DGGERELPALGEERHGREDEDDRPERGSGEDELGEVEEPAEDVGDEAEERRQVARQPVDGGVGPAADGDPEVVHRASPSVVGSSVTGTEAIASLPPAPTARCSPVTPFPVPDGWAADRSGAEASASGGTIASSSLTRGTTPTRRPSSSVTASGSCASVAGANISDRGVSGETA